jgi:hypothetical protein
MDSRVLFRNNGQRGFFEMVIRELRCISLKGILQFGFDMPYSSLKNYYSGRRLLPKNLFDNLCYITKLDAKMFDVEFLDGRWGQAKGGKMSKRVKKIVNRQVF